MHLWCVLCLCLCVCVGNVAVLVGLSVDFQPTVRVYVLLGILGVELLVALPCLVIYTGTEHTFTFSHLADALIQSDLQ